jgi:hypothetical protein
MKPLKRFALPLGMSLFFCTQIILSGDGARTFIDLFPRGYIEVLYAEHFFIPKNVTNF